MDKNNDFIFDVEEMHELYKVIVEETHHGYGGYFLNFSNRMKELDIDELIAIRDSINRLLDEYDK